MLDPQRAAVTLALTPTSIEAPFDGGSSRKDVILRESDTFGIAPGAGQTATPREPRRLDDGVYLYLREIDAGPLLSAAEEVALAERIEAGAVASDALAVGEVGPESRAELERLVADGRAAHRRLVEANLRLVVSVAKRYTSRGVPLLDLIQEGNVGLMRAADRFAPRFGCRFSTYAVWWIRQAVSRGASEQAHVMRFPSNLVELLNRFARVTSELTQQLGRTPTCDELAAAMDLPPAKILELIAVQQEPAALDTPLGGEGGATLGDLVVDDQAVDPADAAALSHLRADLEVVLSCLDPREERLLRLRYGLDGGLGRTLEQAGQAFHVTRERARQIESMALRKLRHPLRSRPLRAYLDASA